MPIATKSGSLIVKDGKLAENCGCCTSGWYCYDCACRNSAPAALLARFTITAPWGAVSTLSLRMPAATGGESCATYSTGWGSVNQCRSVPGYDGSITNNRIAGPTTGGFTGQPIAYAGIAQLAFLNQCNANLTLSQPAIRFFATGSFPCQSGPLWWMGTTAYNPNGTNSSQPLEVQSYISTSSPCFLDSPSLTSPARMYYFGEGGQVASVLLEVTGAE